MKYEKRMVLVHGWAANVAKLEPLANELVKLGWRVMLPKLPGFDLPAPPAAWGVAEYATYVLDEAQQFFPGQSFFFFGHSFGGRLAIKLGAAPPENLSGLILCAAAGVSKINPIKRYAFLVLTKVGKIILRGLPIVEKVRPWLYKLAREHDYEKTQGVMRDVFRKVVAEDLEPAATRITLPALLLWGRQDTLTKLADAYRLQTAMPQARLVIYEHETHRLPYNQPQELAREIDTWVSRLSSD
jgi:pimeloyl-ACP methyl ester carboxylesterase